MLSAASLPVFANGDRWAELNQSFRHIGKWAKFANVIQEFGDSLPKNWDTRSCLFWDGCRLDKAMPDTEK